MSEGAEVSLATGRAGEGLTEQMNGVLRGDGQATESLPRSVASEQTAGDGMDPKAASEAERLPKGIDQRLVSLLAPVSFEAEQYRALEAICPGRIGWVGMRRASAWRLGFSSTHSTTSSRS